jgi:hypothetical protein
MTTLANQIMVRDLTRTHAHMQEAAVTCDYHMTAAQHNQEHAQMSQTPSLLWAGPGYQTTQRVWEQVTT